MTTNTIHAIAVFQSKKVNGTVRFTENRGTDQVFIDVDISIKGKRNCLCGFHVHEYGDMSDQCTSMCSHFNPYQEQHGGPNSKRRHLGDLGNLIIDEHGCAKYRYIDKMIKLRGSKCNIIGRGLVIHADEDDLGLGGHPDSLTTGHAGERIACAVIGYSNGGSCA
jgi:Cu-Zn family superoxide dismutase